MHALKSTDRTRPILCLLRHAAGILTATLPAFLISSCLEKGPSSPEDALNLRAPVGLTVAFLTETSVHVEWIDPNDYSATGRQGVRYEVQMSTDSLLFRRMNVTASDSTSMIITYPFALDSTYYFRVRVLSSGAASAFSLVRTPSPAPHAQVSLLVTSISETTITLEWFTTDSSVVKTIIERRTYTEETFLQVDTVHGPVFSRTVRGPYFAETIYYFRVQTVSGLHARSYSDTAMAVLRFSAPHSLRLLWLADTAAALSWEHSNPYAQTVVAEYRQSWSAAWSALGSVSAWQPSAIFLGRFVKGHWHAFRISLHSNYNHSDYCESDGHWF